MILNLFSIFDPSTSIYFRLNWLRNLIVYFYIPIIYWFIPDRNTIFLLRILNFLFKEFFIIINSKVNKINIILYLNIFLIIFLNNFLGLWRYIFTATRHIRVNLAISISIWISFIIFGWLNFTNNIFIHLIPQGTPIALIFFIVIIETIRNFIRFGTLAIRLRANIIAGHLLLLLLSLTIIKLNFFLYIILISTQILLLILELAVRIIQSYVFRVLLLLYRIEIN